MVAWSSAPPPPRDVNRKIGTASANGVVCRELVWLHYWDTWFVIALTLTLVRGKLVPFTLTAPTVQVKPPFVYVWDPAGGA